MAKLSEVYNSFLPVGAVQHSILTLAQFQAVMGTDWVLMNGASIVGSKLAGITGDTNLPDATGRFLRNAGGSAAALKAAQGQGTAKNGLSNAASSVSGSTSINHSHGTIPSNTVSANHTHSGDRIPFGHTSVPSNSRLGSSTNNQGTFGTGQSTGTISANHTHTVPIPPYSTGNRALVSGNAAAQAISSTDGETRPVNITINIFIKIN